MEGSNTIGDVRLSWNMVVYGFSPKNQTSHLTGKTVTITGFSIRRRIQRS